MGEPYLYDVELVLEKEGRELDRTAVRCGVRTVSLRCRDDADGRGRGFGFEINGIPVFCKGSNYVPADAFLPRISREKTEFLVRSAAQANMNMLRVWGGGTYESDDFYEMCDRYGIMVWQDFVFACNMYPGSAQIYADIRAEAEDNVRRLRNHPSLVLWCGNNEIDVAWKPHDKRNSRFRKFYTEEEAEQFDRVNETIFRNILPGVVDSLCGGTVPYWHSSPSPCRASILTGLFTHTHTVVDNQAPKPDDLVFFPQYLQQNVYRTAFFGKWHMGNQDDMPQPGFDHWEGFRGQGTYYNTVLNINGERVKFDPELYSTDILTDHAIDFVRDNEEGPFFIYLSYKSVHSGFQPSPSRKGMYKDEKAVYPPSFNVPEYGIPRLPGKDADGRPLAGRGWYGESRLPDWVKNQRESWHGVDYQYHGALPYEEDFRNYCETVTSMDDAIGRLLDFLQAEGLGESTLVIYMGDNGFTWGEHGLIDKRNFYEPSVRVPMLAYCPELIPAGRTVEEMVQNIDVAPTIMAACGLAKAPQMCGESFLPLLKGGTAADWRKRIYYEYYWEYAFPQTPTVFGVRTDRYKYIRYHGIWDTNEFFDLQEDPYETVNLIDRPELQDTIRSLANDLYDWLETTGGMQIPLKRSVYYRHGDHRNAKTY